MRIGHSFDIHQLVAGRKLILGGIEFKHDKGLLGHSDADCLLHAISEALLGSLALGDLGTHFPDNDPQYKGIDSREILRHVGRLVKENNYYIVNIDATIYAEEPKINPFILSIRQSIASILEMNIKQISVKATTYEKMGPIGEKKAIASEAVVLVEENENLVRL